MAHALQRILIGDEPDDWRAAGFSVLGDQLMLGKVAVQLVGTAHGRGFLGWEIAGVAEPIDGLATAGSVLGRPSEGPVIELDRAPEVFASANAAFAIDHVVIETTDVDRTISAFAAVGMAERRSSVMSTPIGDRRQSFLWAGRVIIEVVGPVKDDISEISEGAASVWGLALVSSNLQTTSHVLQSNLSEPRDAVQPGRKIATVRTRELGISVPIVMMSPHVAELL